MAIESYKPQSGGLQNVSNALSVGKSLFGGGPSTQTQSPSTATQANNFGASQLQMPQLGQSAGYGSDPMGAINRRMSLGNGQQP